MESPGSFYNWRFWGFIFQYSVRYKNQLLKLSFKKLLNTNLIPHTCFYMQPFFNSASVAYLFHSFKWVKTLPQILLCSFLNTFTQMLLWCCLIHITIIILRNVLYLVYLRLYLGVGLFMSYLLDAFFIFRLVFIIMNHIISLKQASLFFADFLKISPLTFRW